MASAARIAHHATLLAAGLILVLHGLEPEIAPSWRFISEYALGPFGWLLSVAFLTFGMAHLALVTALHLARRAARPDARRALIGSAAVALLGTVVSMVSLGIL